MYTKSYWYVSYLYFVIKNLHCLLFWMNSIASQRDYNLVAEKYLLLASKNQYVQKYTAAMRCARTTLLIYEIFIVR